jgi:hypothetical protein
MENKEKEGTKGEEWKLWYLYMRVVEARQTLFLYALLEVRGRRYQSRLVEPPLPDQKAPDLLNSQDRLWIALSM